MAITPRNDDLLAGVAGQRSQTFDPASELLLTGDNPKLATAPYGTLGGQVLPARTVVGFNGAGLVIPAVLGTTAAVGFVMYAADSTGKGDGVVTVEVVRQGVFNPNALVWDATYNTAAKKRLAFEGAPTPTSIILRAPQAMSV